MHSQNPARYFPLEVCSAAAFGWGGPMAAFIRESLIACLFLPCKLLPAEAQVYHGKLAPSAGVGCR